MCCCAGFFACDGLPVLLLFLLLLLLLFLVVAKHTHILTYSLTHSLTDGNGRDGLHQSRAEFIWWWGKGEREVD